jgi:phosphonate transport system ATP-binding protein
MVPIVRIKQLNHSYQNGPPVLVGVDFEVFPGEVVGVIGVSGAGKSTLLRCLNGLVTPTSGECVVLAESVPTLNEKQRRLLRRRIGMIFQEFNLLERLTVLKNVLVGRLGYMNSLSSILHRFSGEDRDMALDCLERVGLSGLERRRVRDLSGGQKQRVAIARALVQRAEILIADEATANLDLVTRREIMQLIVDLAQQNGLTAILSMHDLDLAKRYCTRIVGLKNGRITFDAKPGDLTDEIIEDVLIPTRESGLA